MKHLQQLGVWVTGSKGRVEHIPGMAGNVWGHGESQGTVCWDIDQSGISDLAGDEMTGSIFLFVLVFVPF